MTPKADDCAGGVCVKKPIITVSILLVVVFAVRIDAQSSNQLTLTCEVLEVSNEYRGDQKDLGTINYLIIRHKNAEDQKRFSDWLKSHSGAGITFTTPDGVSHQGVVRRLKVCFGRGLLIFVGPVQVKERDSIVVQIQLFSTNSQNSTTRFSAQNRSS
jgi:hypothetical protein